MHARDGGVLEVFLQVDEPFRGHGVDSLVTGNDAENHPMLAVIRELGYRPLPGGIELLRDLGESESQM